MKIFLVKDLKGGSEVGTIMAHPHCHWSRGSLGGNHTLAMPLWLFLSWSFLSWDHSLISLTVGACLCMFSPRTNDLSFWKISTPPSPEATNTCISLCPVAYVGIYGSQLVLALLNFAAYLPYSALAPNTKTTATQKLLNNPCAWSNSCNK